MSIKNNVYKGLVILTLLSAHVSCAQQLSKVTSDKPSDLSDTTFLIFHEYHYIDSTNSFNIHMYDSVITKRSILDLTSYQSELDFILRDIYLHPFDIHARESKKAIEMFFLMLQIKDRETHSNYGNYYNPYVKFSNFFSVNLSSYSCTYSDYQWKDESSNIQLTIHSISPQVLSLYESFFELRSDKVGQRTFLLAKAGNRIQITMNEDFANKFIHQYSYFFN